MIEARLFPKLDAPVVVADSERFALAPILEAANGEAEARKAIQSGVFRPSDIRDAEISRAALLLVPFWRVDVSVDGFHIGLSSTQTSNGRVSIPIPTGGARHKDAVLMICARSAFPYEAKVPGFLSGIASSSSPLEVSPGELGLWSALKVPPEAEVLDADVGKEDAKRYGGRAVMRAVMPGNALYSNYQPDVRSIVFCHYPLYYVRYRYEGEARRHVGEDFFVAISARTGKIIAAKHPSAMRSATAKIRRLLSFS